MTGAERVCKRSCPFCQHPSRDELEEALLLGEISPKQLDQDMGWRFNTADRHYRNHMGQFHMASNPQCKICSHPERAEFEERFLQMVRNPMLSLKKSVSLNLPYITT